MGIRRQISWGQILLFTGLLILAIIVISPFIWMISTSFKHEQDALTTVPNLLPASIRTGRLYLSFENYKQAFAYGIQTGLINSLWITAILVPSKLFLDALAAYAFARIPFPGRERLFLILLTTIMVPSVAILIPRVYMTKLLGIYDTPWAIIVPNLISVWDIFLMRQFFMALPKELDESAKLDGASHFRIFWSIILPNSQPVLAVVAITSFIFHWNDLIWPLVVINNPAYYTLPLSLALLNSYVPNPTLIMAGAVVAVIPVLIVFLVFQRRILQGFSFTGMKL